VKKLTNFHMTICERMFLIYEGNVDKMSIVMGAPSHLIASYIREQKFELPDAKRTLEPHPDEVPAKRRGIPYHSVRNYNQEWYNAYEKAQIHPWFVPCTHDDGPCNEDNCFCLQNHLFCTHACQWGRRSRNFFRGCDCKGACNAKSCACFAANMECDPNVCKCDTCTDPPDKVVTNQKCRNDSITMRRRGAHLLVAESEETGAGFGIYNKRVIQRGEFIDEYVGEIITQEDADNRHGQMDDSYLFGLSSDYVIDAKRKGNKTRFMNHSDEMPNVAPKIMFVQGYQRIGFYAGTCIPCQTELTFDYAWDKEMDNDLIVKAPRQYPWKMGEGSDAGKNLK